MLYAMGDKEGFQKASALLKQREAALKNYCAGTGRAYKSDRVQVSGFGRGVSSKATMANKSANQLKSEQMGGIITQTELFRKTSLNANIEGVKYISDDVFQQLTIEARKMGATVIRGTAEVEAHLAKHNASASQIADVLLFGKNTTRSDVLEEVYHYKQNLHKLNDDKDIVLRTILNEIDVKRYLIANATKLKIPRAETNITQAQLEQYLKQLENYYSKQGG